MKQLRGFYAVLDRDDPAALAGLGAVAVKQLRGFYAVLDAPAALAAWELLR